MIEIAGTTTTTKELVQPRAELDEAPVAVDPELRRACLAALREEWSSLVLVAMDAAAGQAVAGAIAELARAYRLRPVRVLAGAGAGPAQVALLQDQLAAARDAEARVVVTVGDPRASPAAGMLLVHAGAALLAVRLGATELPSIEEAVALAGRERILGCVVAR